MGIPIMEMFTICPPSSLLPFCPRHGEHPTVAKCYYFPKSRIVTFKTLTKYYLSMGCKMSG